MIALPAATAVIAALCAALVGWDALRRPSPERVTWAVAFLLFTAAAVCEVIGSATGWTPALARLAAQTFTPEPEAEDATNLKVPAGGWDRPAVAGAKPKQRTP